MRKEITREFKNASEKGLKIYYNDTQGDFEIQTSNDEIISFYDDKNGNGKKEAEKFIDEF